MMLERACPAPVCGIDEAGRGPWAGPVCAAAVILRPRTVIDGLDDSKKLPAERREVLAMRIREHALAWTIAEVDARRIDAWNRLGQGDDVLFLAPAGVLFVLVIKHRLVPLIELVGC